MLFYFPSNSDSTIECFARGILYKLTKKHKVLCYDLRGYGRSALPDPSTPYSDVDDLNALLGFLGIEKAHICGLSLGSIVAIDFSLAYPDKCISLISCGLLDY